MLLCLLYLLTMTLKVLLLLRLRNLLLRVHLLPRATHELHVSAVCLRLLLLLLLVDYGLLLHHLG